MLLNAICYTICRSIRKRRFDREMLFIFNCDVCCYQMTDFASKQRKLFLHFFFVLFLKNSFWFRWSVIPMRYHTQWYNYVFRFVVRLKKKSHRSPIASLRTPSFFSYWCAAVYVCLLLINLHGWPWIVRLICLYCQHFHKKNSHTHTIN